MFWRYIRHLQCYIFWNRHWIESAHDLTKFVTLHCQYCVLKQKKLNEWRLVLYRERVRLMCFTCWLRSGFSHFINMDSLSFTWYLVAAESRISKQSGVQDALQNSELCRCLKTFQGFWSTCFVFWIQVMYRYSLLYSIFSLHCRHGYCRYYR